MQGPEGATPVIMLILDDEHAHQMRTAGMEVKARGADVIVITDKASVRGTTLPSSSHACGAKVVSWSSLLRSPRSKVSFVAAVVGLESGTVEDPAFEIIRWETDPG